MLTGARKQRNNVSLTMGAYWINHIKTSKEKYAIIRAHMDIRVRQASRHARISETIASVNAHIFMISNVVSHW